MRRYSTSTIFGSARNEDSSDRDPETKPRDKIKGRRHSSSQLPISSKSSYSSNRDHHKSDSIKSIITKGMLGDVEESHEHEQDTLSDSGERKL